MITHFQLKTWCMIDGVRTWVWSSVLIDDVLYFKTSNKLVAVNSHNIEFCD